MELKPCWTHLKISSGGLLIEPIWNWNVSHVPRWKSARWKLLIEPIWNWNLVKITWHGGFPTSNRTNMELKLDGINRPNLLIFSSNRTNMELKRLHIFCWHPYRISSNRTNMELKLIIRQVVNVYIATSNRTNMELKLLFVKFNFRLGYILLIEPIWNWNLFQCAVKFSSDFLLIEPIWNWN